MKAEENAGVNIGETPCKFMNFGDFLNGSSQRKQFLRNSGGLSAKKDYQYESIADLQAQAGEGMQDPHGLLTPDVRGKNENTASQPKTNFLHVPSTYNPQVYQFNNDLILQFESTCGSESGCEKGDLNGSPSYDIRDLGNTIEKMNGNVFESPRQL